MPRNVARPGTWSAPVQGGARGLLLCGGRCFVLSFGHVLAGKSNAGLRRDVVHSRAAVSALTTSSQHRKHCMAPMR